MAATEQKVNGLFDDPAAEPAEKIPDYADYARAVLGMPEGWRWVVLDASPEACPEGYVKVEGAVCPTRPRGGVNWEGRTVGTERTHFIKTEDFEAWKAKVAAERGVCVRCFGGGKIWAGWNHKTGDRYEECRKCNGTGNPTEPQ